MNEKEMFGLINAHADAADLARAAAAEGMAKRKLRKVATVEAGMLLLILLLTAMEAAGLLSGTVAGPSLVLTLCAMNFLGGYAVGNC